MSEHLTVQNLEIITQADLQKKIEWLLENIRLLKMQSQKLYKELDHEIDERARNKLKTRISNLETAIDYGINKFNELLVDLK